MGDYEAGTSVSVESLLGYHPSIVRFLTCASESTRGTMSGGEFDWGGRLRKGIGGAQRSSQDGREPSAECKGRREADCEADGPGRYESRT